MVQKLSALLNKFIASHLLVSVASKHSCVSFLNDSLSVHLIFVNFLQIFSETIILLICPLGTAQSTDIFPFAFFFLLFSFPNVIEAHIKMFVSNFNFEKTLCWYLPFQCHCLCRIIEL